MAIPVREQLKRIRSGAEEVIPEEELVRRLERSVAGGEPLRVRVRLVPCRAGREAAKDAGVNHRPLHWNPRLPCLSRH